MAYKKYNSDKDSSLPWNKNYSASTEDDQEDDEIEYSNGYQVYKPDSDSSLPWNQNQNKTATYQESNLQSYVNNSKKNNRTNSTVNMITDWAKAVQYGNNTSSQITSLKSQGAGLRNYMKKYSSDYDSDAYNTIMDLLDEGEKQLYSQTAVNAGYSGADTDKNIAEKMWDNYIVGLERQNGKSTSEINKERQFAVNGNLSVDTGLTPDQSRNEAINLGGIAQRQKAAQEELQEAAQDSQENSEKYQQMYNSLLSEISKTENADPYMDNNDAMKTYYADTARELMNSGVLDDDQYANASNIFDEYKNYASSYASQNPLQQWSNEVSDLQKQIERKSYSPDEIASRTQELLERGKSLEDYFNGEEASSVQKQASKVYNSGMSYLKGEQENNYRSTTNSKLNNYLNYMYTPGFDEKSSYTGTIDNIKQASLPELWENWLNTKDSTVYTEIAWRLHNDRSANAYYNEMDAAEELSDNELAVYNYLYNTQGYETADQYLKDIDTELTARRRAEMEEQNQKLAESHPLLASAATIAESPMGVVSALGQAGDYIESKVKGGYIDPNSFYNEFSRFGTDVRSDVSQQIYDKLGEDNGADVVNFIYQTGMSMGDFLTNSALTGAAGEAVSLGLMGAGAMAQTVLDMKDEGLTDDRAFTLGVIAGAAEVVTEKVSLETLLDETSLGKDTFTYFIKNIIAEGSEEGASDLINWTADDLYDLFSGTNEAEWKRTIGEYQDQGMSYDEAFSKAIEERAKTIGLDMGGGALSGGLMAGGMAAKYSAKGINLNDALKQQAEEKENNEVTRSNVEQLVNDGDLETIQSIVDEGLQSENDFTYNRARKLQDQIYKGETVAASDVMKVYDKTFDRVEEDNYQTEKEQYESAKKQIIGDDVEFANGRVKSKADIADLLASYSASSVRRNSEQIYSNRVVGNSSIAEAAKTIGGERGQKLYGPVVNSIMQNTKVDQPVAYKEFTRLYNSGLIKTNLNNYGNTSTLIPASVQERIIQAGLEDRESYMNELVKQAGLRRSYTEGAGVNLKEPALANALLTGKVSRETVNVVHEFSKALGAKVSFVDGLQYENGSYDRDTGVITLSLNTLKKDGRQAMMAVFGHELTHRVQDLAPEAFENLKNTVVKFMGADKFNMLVQHTMNLAQTQNAKGAKIYMDNNMAQDEVISDFVGQKFFSDKEFQAAAVKELTGMDLTLEDNRSKLQKVIDWIKGIIRKLSGKKEYMEEVKSLKDINDSLITALKSAQVQAAKNAKVTENTSAKGLMKMADAKAPMTDVDQVKHSILNSEDIVEASILMNDDLHNVSNADMRRGRTQIEMITKLFRDQGIQKYLPVENEANLSQYAGQNNFTGNTTVFGNSSYGYTAENSTICIRSLGMETLLDLCAEKLGHSLTNEEAITLSQMAWSLTDQPTCQYCYVFADRLAARNARYQYIVDRDKTLSRVGKIGKNERLVTAKDLEYYKAGKDGKVKISKSGSPQGQFDLQAALAAAPEELHDQLKAYNSFLNKRANTPNARERFVAMMEKVQNGDAFVTHDQVASEESIRKAAEQHPELAAELTDIIDYAKKASHAKTKVEYTAYNNDILKLSDDIVNAMNTEYGIRFYSYSDFHPAFILENMQMFMDASVRGLKGLAYTKDCAYAKIFASTGVNINISCKMIDDAKPGQMDGMQGADWDEAKALRQQYPNVGVVMVCTSDAQVNWALKQDWVDVVLPYHVCFSNAVGKAFGWKNYKSFQEDKKIKGQWNEDTDLKHIAPPMHQNNKEKYLQACRDNHLEPRFKKWVEDPNYMKLVNETRQSEGETQPLRPVFDTNAVMSCVAEMIGRGGYGLPFGGDYETTDDIAQEFVDRYNAGERLEDQLPKKSKTKGKRSSITAAEDDAYMDAYNDGDDEKMQELVDLAAKKAGYQYKAFHHTENRFTEFDLSKARKSMDIQGFYFSESPDAESEYGSVRYDTYLRMNNPYIVDSKESQERIPMDYSKDNSGVTAREWLQENGYDGVIRKADYFGSEADEYIVFDSSQIKSADPVTYDEDDEVIPLSERFNDWKKDIRYSLQEIVTRDGKNLGTGVYLDSTVLNGKNRNRWPEIISRVIYNMQGLELPMLDDNGKIETVYVANKNDRVRKIGAKNSHKVIEELSRVSKYNEPRLLATAQVSELLISPHIDYETNDEHTHQWLDENGWINKTVLIQMPNKDIYKATLSVANGKDRKIIYKVGKVEPIDVAENTDITIDELSGNNLSQDNPKVNKRTSIKDESGTTISEEIDEIVKSKELSDTYNSATGKWRATVTDLDTVSLGKATGRIVTKYGDNLSTDQAKEITQKVNKLAKQIIDNKKMTYQQVQESADAIASDILFADQESKAAAENNPAAAQSVSQISNALIESIIKTNSKSTQREILRVAGLAEENKVLRDQIDKVRKEAAAAKRATKSAERMTAKVEKAAGIQSMKREERAAKTRERDDRKRLLSVLKRLNRIKADQANRKLIKELLGDIYLEGVNKSELASKRLDEINDYVNRKTDQNSDDYDPDFIITESLKKDLNNLAKVPISEMHIEDVRTLLDAALEIENQIRSKQKTLSLIGEDEGEDIYDIAARIEINFREGKGLGSSRFEQTFDQLIPTATLRPSTQILRYVGFNENSWFYKLFYGEENSLAAGQRKMVQYQYRANHEYFESFYTNKKFIDGIMGKHAREITISGIEKGSSQVKEVKITPDMLMALYMHSRNASNMRHIWDTNRKETDAEMRRRLRTGDDNYSKGYQDTLKHLKDLEEQLDQISESIRMLETEKEKNEERAKLASVAKEADGLRKKIYGYEMNAEHREIKTSAGGIKIPDIKLYKEGRLEEAYRKGIHYKISKSEIERLCQENLTEREWAFIKAAQNYYSEMSQNEINEVSDKLVGRPLAEVTDYFHIDTDKDYMRTRMDSIKYDGTVEGIGILKARVEASNPVNLISLTDQLRRDIKTHSLYVGMAIPVRNFNKVYGIKQDERDEKHRMMESNISSVQSTLREVWSGSANNYIEKLMKDIQSPSSEREFEWIGKLRSNYAGAVLTLNLGVAIKQAASYPTAAAVIGWKPLIKAFGNSSLIEANRLNMDIINRYSPLMYLRTSGWTTQEMVDMKNSQNPIIQKVFNSKLLNWIQGMDVATVKKLWKASEYYVNDHLADFGLTEDDRKVKNSAYLTAVGKIHTEVIEKTQPNYSVLQRGQLLRTNNELVRTVFGMFKTQPFQNFSILYEAFGNYAAKRNVQKVNPNARNKAALQAAGVQLRRAISSQILSGLVFALMQIGWDLIRRKDDKYTDDDGAFSVAKALQRLTIYMGSNAFGMIPFGSILYETIENVADKIITESGGDAFFEASIYGLDASSATEIINNTESSIVTVFTDIIKLAKGEADAEGLIRDTVDTLTTFGQYANIPVENIVNDVSALASQMIRPFTDKYTAKYYSLRIGSAVTSSNKSTFMKNLYNSYDNGVKTGNMDDYNALLQIYENESGFASKNSTSKEYVDDKMESYIKAEEKAAADKEHGITDDIWDTYETELDAVDQPTEDGKYGTYSQEEKYQALMQMDLTTEQRAYIWSTFGYKKTWSEYKSSRK